MSTIITVYIGSNERIKEKSMQTVLNFAGSVRKGVAQ